MSAKKTMEKTLEAKTATLLKYMLDMELSSLKDRVDGDLVLFVGVDGRIFSGLLPDMMTPPQFYFFNLVKDMLPSICAQLRSENMRFSMEQYPEGVVLTSGVGKNAFIVLVKVGEDDVERGMAAIKEMLKVSQVVLHIFEQRPMTEASLSKLPDEVADELSGG
ncbi:MAG: hypothetical protein J7L61_01920 [Thermoplasmata archaeon]|nr:hypothetical protein [Thermoplasmata archaeon]